MATIQSSLVFQDKMTSAINSVSNALESASISSKLAKENLDALERAQQEWKTTLDLAQNSNVKNQKNIDEVRKKYNEASKAVDKATLQYLKYEGQVIKNTTKLEQLRKKQEEFNQKLDDTERKSKGATEGLTIFGVAVGSIIGNLASRAFDTLKNSIGTAIQSASDLAEVQNVVDVAFKENASAINDWSRTALNQFGLNELSAKRYAGTMGAMLKSSGLAGDQVAVMSMKIAELTGDMASFYNLDPTEAFAKLRSGISGETEPLKQLGINMSVANLEAYALSQGLKTKYKDMSQAAQMTLRYQYLLQATADAQGDFARTSASFANQQKLANENWLRLTATIANMFIPAMTAGYQIANSLMNFFIDSIIPTLEIVVPILTGIATGIFAYNIPSLVILGKQWAIAGAKALWAGLKMAGAWLMALGPVGLVIAGVGALIGLMVVLVNKCKPVAEIFYKIANAIDGAFTAFKKWRNRGDEKMVAKIEADYQTRIQERADKVAGIGNTSNKSAGSGFGLNMSLDPDLMTSTSGGKALKTENQGEIKISEEDIKLLHDISTRDYMVNYQQMTPQVTLQGLTINELVDANQVVDMIVDGITQTADSKLQVVG